MKTINLLGAPGSGKSTTMLGLTYQMKLMGLSVENTPEFFKELILEGSDNARFGGQLFILGEQNRRLARCVDKNDFVVTDCPLPLIGYYTPDDYVSVFDQMVCQMFDRYDNVNYFIERTHAFENDKRNHDEEKALKIERELPEYLDKRGIKFKVVKSNLQLVEQLTQDLLQSKVITSNQLHNDRIEFFLLEKYKQFLPKKTKNI